MNKELFEMYFKRYPLGTMQDFVKYLYQATLGSGHLVHNIDDNYIYLEQEYDSIVYDETHELFEEISEELVRVHLEAIPRKYLRYYHHFFMESVKVMDNDLPCVLQSISESDIPFAYPLWKEYIDKYIQDGCPIARHSIVFRENYHPHYRLMHKKFIPYISLLEKIEKLDSLNVIAIDGNSGSGKSTLANLLSNTFGYSIVSMDDFFLQPHQRTKERLAEVGGNVDYERFFEEVIVPLQGKKDFEYQVFDCSCMQLTSSKSIVFDKGIIVEGSYSLHPCFGEYYDYSIFLEVDEEIQKQRILKRNGEQMLSRFINEWIPKENAYFHQYEIKKKAKLTI